MLSQATVIVWAFSTPLVYLCSLRRSITPQAPTPPLPRYPDAADAAGAELEDLLRYTGIYTHQGEAIAFIVQQRETLAERIRASGQAPLTRDVVVTEL